MKIIIATLAIILLASAVAEARTANFGSWNRHKHHHHQHNLAPR
jgi:hypothetical protein